MEDEFGAAYGVLLNSSDDDPPVFSLPLQIDVAQFFDSVTLMFVTLAAWLRAGLGTGYGYEGKPGELQRYIAIAGELNPKSCYSRDPSSAKRES